MEIRQLTYFKTIAETENISQASKRLHVSQPFLSRTIRSMEEELGVPLFNRSGRKISLNENGQILYHYAERIIQLHTRAVSDLKQRQNGRPCLLKIAMLNATDIFPELITRFSEEHSDVSFSILRFSSPEEIPDNCDIIIHASDTLADKMETTVLFQEECLLGMSIHHPLASREAITPELLEGETFLLLTQDNSLGELTRRYFRPLQIRPRVPLQCDSQQTLTAFVEEGMGLAFFPSRTWKIESDKILLRQIQGHTLKRNIYLSLPSEIYSSETTTFREFVFNYIKLGLQSSPAAPSASTQISL